MPETQNSPVAPTMPTTPVPAAKPANNKLVISFVVAGIIIIVLAVAALYFTGALDTLLGRKSGGATINAAEPHVAVSQLNALAIKSVEDLDTEGEQALDFTSMFAQIGLNTTSENKTAELAIDFTVTSQGLDFSASLSGVVKDEGDNKVSMQINGNLNGDNPEIGTIKVPFDMTILDNTLYVKIGEVPNSLSDISPQLALVAKLFEDEWIKLDLDEATQLATTNSSVETKLTAEEKDQLLALWKENPPFQNGRSTAGRSINGAQLNCMLTDLNKKAFETEVAAVSSFSNLPTLEICNKGVGELPVFFGFDIPENEGTSGVVGITIISYGKEVNITAPAGAKSLDELLGGFGI